MDAALYVESCMEPLARGSPGAAPKLSLRSARAAAPPVAVSVYIPPGGLQCGRFNGYLAAAQPAPVSALSRGSSCGKARIWGPGALGRAEVSSPRCAAQGNPATGPPVVSACDQRGGRWWGLELPAPRGCGCGGESAAPTPFPRHWRGGAWRSDCGRCAARPRFLPFPAALAAVRRGSGGLEP